MLHTWFNYKTDSRTYIYPFKESPKYYWAIWYYHGTALGFDKVPDSVLNIERYKKEELVRITIAAPSKIGYVLIKEIFEGKVETTHFKLSKFKGSVR